MHTRKRMMIEKSNTFVILPGRFGTLDETFKVLTWKYMSFHDKPVVFMNILDYYTLLMEMINHVTKSKFTSFRQKSLFQIVNTPKDVMLVIHN